MRLMPNRCSNTATSGRRSRRERTLDVLDLHEHDHALDLRAGRLELVERDPDGDWLSAPIVAAEGDVCLFAVLERGTQRVPELVGRDADVEVEDVLAAHLVFAEPPDLRGGTAPGDDGELVVD